MIVSRSFLHLVIVFCALPMNASVEAMLEGTAFIADQTVTLREKAITPFAAVIERLAKLPLGILAGPDKGFCTRTITLNLDRVDARTALRAAVEGTSYVVSQSGRGLALLPADPDAQPEKALLERRLGAFKPAPGPMYALGAIYNGWLTMATHPGQGWAASILGSADSKDIEFETGENARVSDVLNSLINQDQGGIWVMRALHLEREKSTDQQRAPIVEVFSYRDDAARIAALPCPIE